MENLEQTNEPAEIVLFYDHAAEKLYLNWLNRLAREVKNLSAAYALFAKKVGINSFDAGTLKALTTGNPESWVGIEIEKAVSKFDVPLQPAYREHYWKQFRGIETLVHKVRFVTEDILNVSGYEPFPFKLIGIFPEIVDGEFAITDEFLNSTKPYFETKISTNSEAFRLLNQMKETYEQISEMVLNKTGKIKHYVAVWDPQSNIFPELKIFLTRRNDGTVTINDQTLNQLL